MQIKKVLEGKQELSHASEKSKSLQYKDFTNMLLFSLKAGKSSLRGKSIFSQGLVLPHDIKLGDYLSATLVYKVCFYSE